MQASINSVVKGQHDFAATSIVRLKRERIVAAVWVLTLFSNLPIYIATFVLPILQPLYWIIALCSLTLALRAQHKFFAQNFCLTFPVSLLVYASLCLTWYIAQGGGDTIVLRQRLLGIIVAIAAYATFTLDSAVLTAARRTMVWVVCCSVAINIYDITHPFALVPATSEFATLGRAAGLFINPNQAGAALVLGFVLTIGVVPARFRVPYMFIAAAGVVLTLSRAAILGFALVSVVLALRREDLRPADLLKFALAFAAATTALWWAIAGELEQRFKIDPSLVLDRVLWIMDPSGHSDFSQDQRIELVERGWAQFVTSPIFGNGLGSTELWDLPTSTHNLYVMLASDFGVIGLFILPAILISAMRAQWASSSGGVAAVFLMFWGFFSHNVLTETYLLIGFSIIAALSAQPKAVPYTRLDNTELNKEQSNFEHN